MRDWARKHRLSGFTSGSAPGAELHILREKITYLRPRAVANLEKLITTYEYNEDPFEYTLPKFPIGTSVERFLPTSLHRRPGSGSETSLLQ